MLIPAPPPKNGRGSTALSPPQWLLSQARWTETNEQNSSCCPPQPQTDPCKSFPINGFNGEHAFWFLPAGGNSRCFFSDERKERYHTSELPTPGSRQDLLNCRKERWLEHMVQGSSWSNCIWHPQDLCTSQLHGPIESHLNWVFIDNESILN